MTIIYQYIARRAEEAVQFSTHMPLQGDEAFDAPRTVGAAAQMSERALISIAIASGH
jgi:hypothetical protein